MAPRQGRGPRGSRAVRFPPSPASPVLQTPMRRDGMGTMVSPSLAICRQPGAQPGQEGSPWGGVGWRGLWRGWEWGQGQDSTGLSGDQGQARMGLQHPVCISRQFSLLNETVCFG